MTVLTVGIIYKITYPNGKIYIGQDRTDDINYFGSADSFTIAKDFSEEERRVFTITKQILCRQQDISIKGLNALERNYILAYGSADPKIGYNRTHQQARKHCRTLFKEPQ